MPIPQALIINAVEAFFLVFVRMTGLFVVAPIFGRRNLPTYYKIGFAFFLSLIMINSIPLGGFNQVNGIFEFSTLVAKEFFVGLAIGYVAYLIFTSFYVAGQVIDMQIGFGIVNILDPNSNIQVSITSNFYSILAVLIFIITKGHYILIQALYKSFTIVPLNSAVFNKSLLDQTLNIFGSIFEIAFKICIPVIGAILILDVGMGILTKTVPQLNIFVIGIPLKIIIGLLVIVAAIPLFSEIMHILIQGIDSELFNLLNNLSGK